MSDREYLIRLPWPAPRQSPNASGQGKWRAKSEASKSYKETCGWECKALGVVKADYEYAFVEVTFYPPRHGKYDLDNALASIKQGLDAVAAAIGIDDSQWQEMRLLRGGKGAGGSVLVHIKPWMEKV